MFKQFLIFIALIQLTFASGWDTLNDKIQQNWVGQDVEIQCDQNSNDQVLKQLPASAVSNVNLSDDKRRFRAQVSLNNRKSVIVTGRIYTLAQVPVLNRLIHPGETIEDHDLDWRQIRSETLPTQVIISKQDLIGMTPKHRSLQPQRPLQRSDLQMPTVIKRGQWVQVFYKSGSLSIGAQAEAKNDAALNQPVRLTRPGSKNFIEAVATGPGQAEIKPMVF